MRILYLASTGPSDATRASIPVHLAVNGSVEVGHDVGIVLAGDAAELLKADVREAVEGVGVPPLRELFAKARAHEIPVYVWKGCALARGASDDDLVAIGGSWVTPPDVATHIASADRVVTF